MLAIPMFTVFTLRPRQDLDYILQYAKKIKSYVELVLKECLKY